MVNVKVELVKRGIKVIDLVERLAKKQKRKICYVSFSKRIKENRLKLDEVEEIFDVIGCRLVVMEKDDHIFLGKQA